MTTDAELQASERETFKETIAALERRAQIAEAALAVMDAQAEEWMPRAQAAERELEKARRFHAEQGQILVRERDAARAEAEGLRSAIRWALGEEGDFEPPADAQTPTMKRVGAFPRYWWRIELRRRAALAEDHYPRPVPAPQDGAREAGFREGVEAAARLTARYAESICAVPADGFSYAEVAARRSAALHPERALSPLAPAPGARCRCASAVPCTDEHPVVSGGFWHTLTQGCYAAIPMDLARGAGEGGEKP